jgi:hypothetical protein
LVAATIRASILPRSRFADPAHFAFLQRSQQLRLHPSAQFGDLVEEQRPALAFFEQADPLGDGARERAAGVAEQLRLDQFIRDRRAIERAEPAATTDARGMDRARHELLPGAAFTFDQHRERRGRPPSCTARRTSSIAALPPTRSGIIAAATSGDRSRSRAS